MTASSRTDCIDRVTLLLLEDGSLAASEAAATREHLAACPRCQALAREFDDVRDTVARFADTRASADCPGPHVIATYAEGLAAGGERARLEEHLGSCGRCIADLAALGRELAGLETDPEVVTPAWALESARAMVETAAVKSVPRHAATRATAPVGGLARWLESLRAAAFPLAAATALAIMIMVQIPEPRIEGPIVRGPRVEENAIRLTAPQEGGSLEATGGVISWEPVPGAGTYTVTVVDESGAVMWTGRSAESWIRVPAGAGLIARSTYAFWVTSVLDSGETIESEVRHFAVGRFVR